MQNKTKKTFTIQIDDDTEFELRKFKQQLEKASKEPIDWNCTLKEMVKRAMSEQNIQSIKTRPDEKSASASGPRTKPGTVIGEKPVPKQSKITRYIPVKIKQDLHEKYQGHCAYHGCNKPAEQIHNSVRFSERPKHENLITLCKEHHDFIHQSEKNLADQLFNRFKIGKYVASG